MPEAEWQQHLERAQERIQGVCHILSERAGRWRGSGTALS